MSSAMISLWLLGALVAYTVKGFSGFGPALVVIPLLSVLADAKTALSTSSIIDVVVGAVLLFHLGITQVELRALKQNAIVLGLGTAVGALLVGVIPNHVILILVAASVLTLGLRLLLTGGTNLAGRMWHPRPWVSFLIAGLSGGLVGVSGPYVVAGSVRSNDKSAVRRMLVAVFLIEGIVKVVIYAMSGVLTSGSLILSAVASPAIALGLWVGNSLHHRVSQTTFVRVVALILLALAGQVLATVLP